MLSSIFPKENIPYETILGTINKFPNFSPVGVIRRKDKLFLKIFKGKTAENIKKNKKFSINVVDKPEVFVACILKSEKDFKGANNILKISTLNTENKKFSDKLKILNGENKLANLKISEEKYDFYNEIPILKFATSFILCQTEKISEKRIKDEYGNAKLFLIKASAKEIIVKEKIALVSRVENAIIEALVHATRYKITKGKREKDFVEYYLKLAEKDKEQRKMTKKIRDWLGS